jgi:hypothetical protein
MDYSSAGGVAPPALARTRLNRPAPREQTELRYPTRESEFDHRRLQVSHLPLHDLFPRPSSQHGSKRAIQVASSYTRHLYAAVERGSA